jgi:predicted phage terminase large subunit-like protein
MDEATKKLVRTEFLAFAMKAFASLNKGQSLGREQYLTLLADRLAQVAGGDIRRLVISLPPRHCKTFMGSICLSAWILAHDPSAKILVLSYGHDLAEKIAYAIRTILQSEWFLEAFRTRLAANRAKVSDFVTTDGGGVRSLSIEGGVTGLGADFIIIDDPVEIKDCDNVKRLDRVNELFDNEIKTRLNSPKKGSILIIAHRISEDDLPGHVLKKPSSWHELKLPLIAPGVRHYELSDGAIWQRRKGELLRPDAFTRRNIAELRASKRPGFETLQQQNPGRNERLRIKADCFPFFDPSELPADRPMVLSIDPGQKGGATNSFSVIQAWAPHGGVHLLLDLWREQARYKEFRSAVQQFVRRYRPSVVLVEATGQGPALSSELNPQNGMKVELITPSESKLERLRKHRRIIRDRLVQIPQDALWREDFLQEATLFPYGPFDDQVDALSQYLAWITANPNPQKRPPMATAQAMDSQGRPVRQSGFTPTIQLKGGVLSGHSSRMCNSPFLKFKGWVSS